MGYLRHSNTLVERVYQLEKAHGFEGAGTSEAKQFTAERLAAGASMLVGADTPAQFDSALAALDTKFDADELHEHERNYTPCDLINDYTAGRRVAREPRAAQGTFDETLEKAA